jgi:DNA-binding GntR family transcriptional regulator
MLLSIAPADFRRLVRYLPRGLKAPDSPNPLERAAGHVARLVLTQELHPGQKIPMDGIADEIGASRTPVREALRLLETEGLVASLPNRGFVVRRLDPDETEHLYQARHCIESFLARESFRHRDGEFISDLRNLHRIYAQVLGGPSDRRRLGMLVDKAFHLRIAEQARNPYLTALLANIFDRLILTRPFEGFPVNRMGLAVQEHAQVLAAFEAGSTRGAVDAMLSNIDNGGKSVAAHLRSLREFAAAPAESKQTEEG